MAYELKLRRVDLGVLATGKTLVIQGGRLGTGIGSIRVHQVNATALAATVVTPFSRSPAAVDTQIGEAISFPAGVPLVLDETGQPWMETLPGESLVLSLSAGTTITGSLWYGYA